MVSLADDGGALKMQTPIPRAFNISGVDELKLNKNVNLNFAGGGGDWICAGCNKEIGYGRTLTCMGAFWHPDCFRCRACNRPIRDLEIPINAASLIEYKAHPFWAQKYCPSHEHDGTPRCCSFERLKNGDTRWIQKDGGSEVVETGTTMEKIEDESTKNVESEVDNIKLEEATAMLSQFPITENEDLSKASATVEKSEANEFGVEVEEAKTLNTISESEPYGAAEESTTK
ncbi:hypothetical protein Vadar_024778 [Vaccinium darrowii]|uniref:Uncharacterized protein n=1 Tax=Vaccinium darrowii TaxID=229202 RepID=A0ACB7Y1H1_9ERIC|nr:hypothetical protein Vadar_024778 [Vaccinium darrowii]